MRIIERRRSVNMMQRGKLKFFRFVFAHEATNSHSGQYILKGALKKLNILYKIPWVLKKMAWSDGT